MFVVTFVNMTAFFFCEGVWRHGIFVSRWTENKRDTRVSRKSGLIQPVRWRLRHSWSVPRKVCHMHQTFSQQSVGMTSEGWFILDASASSLGCVRQIWRHRGVGGSSLLVCAMSLRVAVCTAFFVTFRAAPLPKMHEFWAILAEHARLCRHLCETEAVWC